MPQQSENEGFTPENASNVFHPHYTTLEEFKNVTVTVILDLCLRKDWSGKSRDYRDAIDFEMLPF